MTGGKMRRSRAARGFGWVVCVLLILALPLTARVQAQANNAPIAFDIPAGSLQAAIVTLGRQAKLQIVYDPASLGDVKSPGLRATLTPEDALQQLLSGSGLTYRFTGENSVALERIEGADITLDPLRIEGQAPSGSPYAPVEGYVAERSTVGTKTDTPILEVPQSISVVTADEIADRGAQNLEESLLYTPGVAVDSYGSNPEQNYVFTRGYDAPMFLDGVRLGRDYVTGAQMMLEPYGLERIEVLRGPSSVLYGQMAPGGIVNQVTKRPTLEPYHEVQLQGGTLDRIQGSFDLSGPLDDEGQFLYRITALGREADGQMDYQEDERVFVAPAFTWLPDEDTHFTLLTHYQQDWDQLRPVPLPAIGTLYDNPNGELDHDTFLGEPDFDEFERTQVALGYDFGHHFNETFLVQQNVKYTYIDQHEAFSLPIYDFNFPVDLRTVDRLAWDDYNTLETVAVDTGVVAKFDTGPVAHEVLVGVDYRYAENDWEFLQADLVPIDAYDPDYGGGYLTDFVKYIDETETRSQVGIYVQDQVAFGNWRLTGGLRQDWAEAETVDHLTGDKVRQEDDKLTGRVGLTYLFDNGIAPYASYSTSFDPEVGTDGQGQPFKPTTGQQYEIGVKYQPPGANSFVAVSAFHLTRQNVLTRDPNPPVSNPFANIQTGEAVIKGIEFEGKANLDLGLDILASYTYFDSEITKSTTDNLGRPFYFTPEHQASLWVQYAFQSGPLDGFEIGGGARYRGSVWGLGYEIAVPSYVLFDAALRYDFGALSQKLDGVELAVNVQNLFDNEYIANCSYYEGCFYGERRSVLATLNYRW